MLYSIKNNNDLLLNLIKDDPIRPEIPPLDRIGDNKEVLVWLNEGDPEAVVCINYQTHIPEDVSDLISSDNPLVAVFYTIWSYKPRAGKKLLFAAKDYIKDNRPTVERFVTLSPKTDMARKFHMFNGAIELRVNKESVNYEYL